MKCPRCQAQNDEGARFCEECGAPFELACPSCGEPVGVGKKFCRSCGAPLTGEPSRFSSLQAYTPKHLADRILTSKSALEGERKQVTVLFADIKGSMELLANRDPEAARKILDPVLERMMEAVHHYEGTVNQVMGDGIMALFGAPLAHEDHAVRACYAALRMQDSVKRHSEEARRRVGVPISIRIGLNSGEVVVRSIGSDLHMDYTAVGQTTHLAARMEQAALPGSILISLDTLRLAEGYVQVKPVGPVPVKGLSEPVEVYEVTGAGSVRTRLQASVVRGLTRFVGRDAELEQLRRTLTLAGEGHGQVVAIVGQAGVGKSRLFYEFTHSHWVQSWLILESGSVPYGKATSYLPVVDLLKAYFKVQDRDDHREIREKITGKLLTLDETLKPTLPAFFALLDVPVEDPQWQALDPPQRRQRSLDAVKRLLVRESQVQPLVLVFEDLQWIDTETQALLDILIESLPTTRLLLLVNYRPEYQHGWTNKTFYSQVRLDILPAESTGKLLDTLLGTDVGLDSLKQLLLKRGNPFFLEESVRTLVETKALVGERGTYRLTRPVQTLQVPATVQAVLAARIDRLAVEEKQLLQAAAVVGKNVPYALLYAIGALPEDTVQRGLTHLQAAEFLYETSLFPDREYTFKHALTHEVTYGTLLQEPKRTLHARIVGVIERLYSDRLVEHVERLGYHAVRGELWEKAVDYLRQAGTKAQLRSASREAVACFEQALAALAHLPETRETLEQAIDLRFNLRTSLFLLGELQRVTDYLREAEDLARTLDDQRRLGWVSLYMSHNFLITGYPTEARTFGQSAQAIAEMLADFPLLVGANIYLGAAHQAAGDFRQSEDLLRKVVQSLEGDLSRERFRLAASPAVLSRFYLGWSLADRGTLDEGIAVGQDGVQIADVLDDPYSVGLACYRFGFVYCVKGDLSQAVRLLERSLAVARDSNLILLSSFAMECLGHAYALSGRVTEGLPLLQQAVKSMESTGMTQYHVLGIMHLGEAYLLVNRLEDALALAEQALRLTRERGQRGYEAYGLRLFGEIASHRDPPGVGNAEGHYHQAMALAEELGMRPLVAHCHLGLGKLYHRTGKQQRAQEHLATGIKLFREMDMRFWLEQGQVGLAELG